jgi:hypothetical protein
MILAVSRYSGITVFRHLGPTFESDTFGKINPHGFNSQKLFPNSARFWDNQASSDADLDRLGERR